MIVNDGYAKMCVSAHYTTHQFKIFYQQVLQMQQMIRKLNSFRMICVYLFHLLIKTGKLHLCGTTRLPYRFPNSVNGAAFTILTGTICPTNDGEPSNTTMRSQGE